MQPNDRDLRMLLIENMEIRVFLIPGGEAASRPVYEQFEELLEAHEDLALSIYHGPNKYDGKWHLVLIGEKTSLLHSQAPIQQLLSQAQAQPISVPPQSLAPLVEKFLERQIQMRLKKQTFFNRHHLLNKNYYAKKKKTRRSQRGKKSR